MFPNLSSLKNVFSDKFILADNMKFRKVMQWWKDGLITKEERDRLIDEREVVTMVKRGFPKHTKFFGQEEVEAHQIALSDKSMVCYYCLAELEEKYGMEQALRQRVIKF